MKVAAHWGLVAVLLSLNAYAGDISNQVSDCEACHGPDGVSSHSDVPTIAGMSDFYLTESLIAYKDATRPCPKTKYPDGPKKGEETDMCAIASELSEADAEAIARHFSNQQFVSAEQPYDAAKAAKGQKLHDMLCEKCHFDGGQDPEDDAGILAGQWKPYLEATMADYRSGARPMIDKMAVKFEQLGDEEVEALLHFYASQQ